MISLIEILPPSVRRSAKKILPYKTQVQISKLLSNPLKGAKFNRLMFSMPAPFFRKYQYPKMLSIFLTTRCNLHCFICRRENFKPSELDFTDLTKLKTAIKYAHVVELTGWGEPLLYPKFGEVLLYVYSLNPSKSLIQFATNGTRLSADVAHQLSGHLHAITISLNAATAEIYNRDMKGGNFETTISAIKNFMTALDNNDKRKITLHFVAHSKNINEIPEFVSLASQLGISKVGIGQYLVGISEHSQYTLLNCKQEYNAAIEQARILGNKLGVAIDARQFFADKVGNIADCPSPFVETYVTTTGEVSVCCYCGEDGRMGNAYEESFEAVWFNKAYRRLRKKLYLRSCQECIQFEPLDNISAHFLKDFVKTEEFKKLDIKK
jgi:MoaA/NifB/PqqE/SkfB family radical SAM enzyme